MSAATSQRNMPAPRATRQHATMRHATPQHDTARTSSLLCSSAASRRLLCGRHSADHHSTDHHMPRARTNGTRRKAPGVGARVVTHATSATTVSVSPPVSRVDARWTSRPPQAVRKPRIWCRQPRAPHGSATTHAATNNAAHARPRGPQYNMRHGTAHRSSTPHGTARRGDQGSSPW